MPPLRAACSTHLLFYLALITLTVLSLYIIKLIIVSIVIMKTIVMNIINTINTAAFICNLLYYV
jgi:hypothetical protein